MNLNLKKLLATVAGAGKSAAELRAEIADIRAQEDEAHRLVAGANALKNQFLMADDDKGVDELEKRVRAAQRLADKAAVGLPVLEQQLIDAIKRENRDRIAHFQRETKSIADEIGQTMRALIVLNQRAENVRTTAFRELGSSIANNCVPEIRYHGMTNDMGLDAWSNYVRSELRGMPVEWPKPALVVAAAPAEPKPVAAEPKAPESDANGNVEILVTDKDGIRISQFDIWAPGTRVIVPQGFARQFVAARQAEYVVNVPGGRLPKTAPIYPGRQPPMKATPAARPPLPKTPPEGFVRVTVMRSGYPDNEGRQCERGTVIDVPDEIATMAVANSAAEFFQELPAQAGGE